jgi:hypothetical protein
LLRMLEILAESVRLRRLEEVEFNGREGQEA